ncbi:MAG: hypothetical protein ACXVBE_11455, partial [Bdellovibrionota bacterium]
NPDNTLRDRYMMYFTLGEKEEKTIQLAKLNVPRIDGSYNFEVFVDVTNKVEQEKVLRALWIKAEPGELIGFHGGKDLKKNTFCKREEWHSGVALGIRVCAALKNDRYLDLLGSYIRFGTDATVDSLTDKFENYDSNDWNFRSVLFPEDKPERMVVGNGRDGESVYIFPGTYGIRFTSAGGHHTDHYGVVVK